ncbi:MAG: hypothetical protein PHN55_12720 [Dysgonamonadaceae bacterium]|nr:hypothetical protein [Dysgonamonadaceae bacterium]
MKEAGINRAFIGNIGIDNLPYENLNSLATNGGISYTQLLKQLLI